mmetsp:Transcript_63561/g.185847  ORF Transcript_63561/g.185847 Transcript_63561/m.185847 type:complete len:229 (-) Transcript_63561:239-925(-)
MMQAELLLLLITALPLSLPPCMGDLGSELLDGTQEALQAVSQRSDALEFLVKIRRNLAEVGHGPRCTVASLPDNICDLRDCQACGLPQPLELLGGVLRGRPARGVRGVRPRGLAVGVAGAGGARAGRAPAGLGSGGRPWGLIPRQAFEGLIPRQALECVKAEWRNGSIAGGRRHTLLLARFHSLCHSCIDGVDAGITDVRPHVTRLRCSRRFAANGAAQTRPTRTVGR